MDSILAGSRWYDKHTRIPLSTVAVPQLLEVDGFLRIMEKDISLLWPWDVLRWLHLENRFKSWVCDAAETAEHMCAEPCKKSAL